MEIPYDVAREIIGYYSDYKPENKILKLMERKNREVARGIVKKMRDIMKENGLKERGNKNEEVIISFEKSNMTVDIYVGEYEKEVFKNLYMGVEHMGEEWGENDEDWDEEGDYIVERKYERNNEEMIESVLLRVNIAGRSYGVNWERMRLLVKVMSKLKMEGEELQDAMDILDDVCYESNIEHIEGIVEALNKGEIKFLLKKQS